MSKAETSEQGSQATQEIERGSIVVLEEGSELPKWSYGDVYFYVDDPKQFDGDEELATVFQISRWTPWKTGVPRADLKIVGKTDPLKTRTSLKKDGENYLPKTAMGKLREMGWLNYPSENEKRAENKEES